ncbi:hypothetical protein K2224_04330 [Streptomyces sp. BHT-5-2]|uniref:hypothetical protein n=1 Tax=unclassified Streptomyces TaxID=2593676 RepID=UPI001C8E7430|nr:hypothetical protein [Streptomyces sp. BHT-5-2]QZL02542.1 hypothetical protein K2224_04330 [Streptomyces sp. BHT-5-2]
MDWIWYVFMLTGPAVYAGSTVSKTVRRGLKTRHKRKLALIEARRDERLALEAADRPPAPVCGCEHHLAKHDRQGGCHETVETAVAWDADKKPVRYEARQCACQQYVGPQPLSQVYADELTDLA